MSLLKIVICLAVVYAGYKYVSPQASSKGAKSYLGSSEVQHLPPGQLTEDDKRLLAQHGISAEGAVVVSRTTQVIDADAEVSNPNVPFVNLPTPSGHSGMGVIVFAPANCPKAAGQRADDMMSRLASSGIPATRARDANFSTEGMSPQAIQDLNSVMAGTLPAVFVNGTGKANPSVEEVLAQYRRTKG